MVYLSTKLPIQVLTRLDVGKLCGPNTLCNQQKMPPSTECVIIDKIEKSNQ